MAIPWLYELVSMDDYGFQLQEGTQHAAGSLRLLSHASPTSFMTT
jgi:hypothetical protein